MKHMLLIHQGDAPTPRSPEEWARIPAARMGGAIEVRPLHQ
jgi:hypothetical protein